MRSSRTTFFAAAGAVVVALLGIPVTSAAAAPRSTTAAAPRSTTSTGAVHYTTCTVKPTGTTVKFVGITHWIATEAVKGTRPTVLV